MSDRVTITDEVVKILAEDPGLRRELALALIERSKKRGGYQDMKLLIERHDGPLKTEVQHSIEGDRVKTIILGSLDAKPVRDDE